MAKRYLPTYLHLLIDFDENTKMVAFADDLTGAGRIESLKGWWKVLCELGPKSGYYPQPAKSWLIVKEQCIEAAIKSFDGSDIKLITKGQRHLDAVIGDITFQKQYCEDIVKTCMDEIRTLSEIVLIEPQDINIA